MFKTTTRLLVNEALRLLEVGGIDTGQGPLAGEGTYFILEVLDLSVALLTLLLGSGDTDEVLEQLGASLLLENEGELDSTMQELADLLDIGFNHVAGRQCGCTDTNTTGNLGGSIARDGVFYSIGLISNRFLR